MYEYEFNISKSGWDIIDPTGKVIDTVLTEGEAEKICNRMNGA